MHFCVVTVVVLVSETLFSSSKLNYSLLKYWYQLEYYRDILYMLYFPQSSAYAFRNAVQNIHDKSVWCICDFYIIVAMYFLYRNLLLVREHLFNVAEFGNKWCEVEIWHSQLCPGV